MTVLPNGIKTAKTVFLGVDWNRKQVDVFDGEKWYVYPNLIVFAKAWPNTFVILESTGESYEVQNRQAVLDAFAKHGIEAYCFPPKWTALYRSLNKIVKNDKNDARAIRGVGTEWKRSLCRFKEIVRTKDKLGPAIRDFLVRDRHEYECEKTLELAEKYCSNYPAEYKDFFLSSDGTRKMVGRFVHVAQKVREAGRGFREYRRQVGNYAQGYGRMPRSEFYWWWAKMGVTAARFKGIREPKVKKDETLGWWGRLTLKQQQTHRQVLKEADKVLKWIWRCTK
jgi:hypothetical protein